MSKSQEKENLILCSKEKGKKYNPSDHKDKGWAFAVLAGVFFMHFILGGVLRSSSLWYILIQSRFNITYAMTMSITGISTSIRFVLSPLMIKIAQATSYQWSVIIGGFMFAMGYIISSYATNFGVFFFFFSIFTGVGSCFVYACSMVVLIQYFDRYRAISLSVATCGTGVGYLVLIPFIDWLIKEFHFSGAMLLTGGIALHLMISGAVYFPIPTQLKVEKFINEIEVTSHDEDSSRKAEGVTTNPIIIIWSDECEEDTNHKLADNPNNINNNLFETKQGHKLDDDLLLNNPLKTNNQTKKITWLKRFLKHVFLSDWKIALFYFSICLTNFGYIPSSYMLKDCMEKNGVSSDVTPIILSFEGGLQIISRFSVGFFLDIPKIKKYRCYFWIFCQLVANLMYIGIAFAHGYIQFLIFLIFLNIMMGVVISQQFTIVGDLIPTDKLPTAVGLMQFSTGIGTLISSPLAGHLRDVTGSYKLPYCFLTVSSMVGSLITLFVLYRRSVDKYKTETPLNIIDIASEKATDVLVSSHLSLNSINVS